MAKGIAGLLFVTTVSIGVAACGSDDDPTYDVNLDCRETIACREETLGPAPEGVFQECIDASNRGYGQATSDQKRRVAAATEECSQRKACAYVECVEDALGIDRIDTSAPRPPADTCSGLTKPLQGSVESTVGTFAYNDGEARFWVNDEGCLTEVNVELKSGSCSVEFSAKGLLDDQGRYLITSANVSMPGLCPGYPDGLERGSYSEYADKQPFGTIEVQREQASWSECRPGTLIVTPNVVLKGFAGTPGKPDIGFSTPIQVSGKFSRTHLDPSGGCPTVFF